MRPPATTATGKVAVTLIAALFGLAALFGIGLVLILLSMGSNQPQVWLSLLLMACLTAGTIFGIWHWRRKVG